MFFRVWEALAVNALYSDLQLLSSLLCVIDMSAFRDLEFDTDTNKQFKVTGNFRKDSRNCGGQFFFFPNCRFVSWEGWSEMACIFFWHTGTMKRLAL